MPIPLYSRIAPYVAQSFGLQDLGRGYQNLMDLQGENIGKTYVNYQWIAQISNWWRQKLTVACTKFDDGLWGVLLTPSSYLKMEFVGAKPLRAVKFPNNAGDKVVHALRAMNVFEPTEGPVPGDALYPMIDIYIYAPSGYRELNTDGSPPLDFTWRRLWHAIDGTVQLLNEAYNDPDVNNFVSNCPQGAIADFYYNDLQGC